MNRNPILLSFVFLTTSLFGQQVDPVKFSLEQAVQYALEHSTSLKDAAIDERIAEAKVKETVGMGLPQVDGTVRIAHNAKLQRLFFIVNKDNPFTGDITDVPEGSVIGTANFFQLPSTGDAGVSVNQLVFNGSYFVGLQAARAFKDLSYKQTNQTREEVITNVMKAYYVSLINKERTHLFDSNIARVDSLLHDTKAMFENGFAESIDVDRVQVNLNNLITERDNFLNLQRLSLELLKFQMNYPQDHAIDVTGNIADIEVTADVNQYDLGWNYDLRADYLVLMANKRLQELNIKNKYAEGMPNLSLFANLGYATASQNISGLFRTETPLEDDGLIGPDKWYPYVGFGLTINVPIFSGLQRSYRIQQEKLTMQKIDNSVARLKSSIEVEQKQAKINFKNHLSALQSQKRNMELSGNVARISRIKYEQGVGSNFEVVSAESDLKESQINYYNALYDVLVSHIDLEKAYGKLLDNIVTDQTK
jgi:outer membrane protein